MGPLQRNMANRGYKALVELSHRKYPLLFQWKLHLLDTVLTTILASLPFVFAPVSPVLQVGLTSHGHQQCLPDSFLGAPLSGAAQAWAPPLWS